MARPSAARVAEAALLASAGALLVMLGWVLLVPLGPPPAADGSGPVVLDAPTRAGLFAQFDPFARDGAAAGAGGESLPLTLLGTRSAADGQGGAAILAGADGVQRAVPVGEEAMPGVRLAQVAFDHVVLQRPGGAVVLRLSGARQEASAPAPATLRFRLSEAGGVPALMAQGAEGQALGLLPGDRIVAVEGVAVRDARAAPQLEAAMQSGRAVAVTVLRGDRALALSLGAAQ
ncbi:type II secretion system protein N [Novosphingobium pokkalii]|uniref:Type II secretion system protein N n=1 Tax=Novosphingobium pokkalii TaxID=1770194 RepID=A0ABV7V6W8_9SPHN|nr:type II secretion system protein N [Novosphingobium pokkalii]GHC88853.1 hypothetical protein GCM10019060_11940 [Novosphingobium pokkalii]